MAAARLSSRHYFASLYITPSSPLVEFMFFRGWHSTIPQQKAENTPILIIV